MRGVDGDGVVLADLEPGRKRSFALASGQPYCILGGVAIGHRDAEQTGTNDRDTANEEHTPFDALALDGGGGFHFECWVIGHHAAPSSADALLAAWPVAAIIALRMRG